MTTAPAKLSVMIGGTKPTGLGDFVATVNPLGVYSLNNGLDQNSAYLRVFRLQNAVWNRLPDACQTDRYFEKEDPEASAEFELLQKTEFIQGHGDLNLIARWQLTGADYNAPYNEWDLGNILVRQIGRRIFRRTIPSPLTSDTIKKADWMVRWNLRAMDLCHEHGIKMCFGSFATGGPDLNLIPYLLPMFRKAKQFGFIYDCHEYGVEGALRDSPSTGALHYRRVYELLPDDCRTPIIMSEFWWGNGVESGSNRTVQIQDAVWYGSELMRDAYVWWASAFQLNTGGENNMPEDMLRSYAQASADLAITGPEPEPEPPEPPIEVLPETPSGDFGSIHPTVVLNGVRWSLHGARQEAGYTVLRNDEPYAGGLATGILLFGSEIYVTNAQAQWFRAVSPGWEQVPADPRTGSTSPPSPQPEPFWVGYPVEPVEPPRVTSPFNDSRDYANGKHEGIDFDSYINAQSRNAKILAAQDGVVEYVLDRPGTGYGKHIVIRHPWGGDQADRYRTLYGHLSSMAVTVGQTVKRGEIIGISGATGTTAIHLHFNIHDTQGLKGYIRESDCSGNWPDGVVDPYPLIRFDESPPNPGTVGLVALRSLHGRADGGALRSVDLQALKTATLLNGYKLFQNAREDYQVLITNGIPATNLLVRLSHVTDRRVTAEQYVNGSTGFYDLPIKEAMAAGVVWFEIFNEPNLAAEGLGVAWTDSTDFCNLCKGVIAQIRKFYLGVKIVSPAMSQNPEAWWEIMNTSGVFAACDALGEHCYWDSRAGTYPMNSTAGGRRYRGLFKYLKSSQKIWITEVSNNAGGDSDVEKGLQYAEYLKTMEMDQVGRVDFFCVSASDSVFNNRRETWVRGTTMSAIPTQVVVQTK